MKIIETKDVPKFKPVTVVFESQAEIDYIAALVGASGRRVEVDIGLGQEVRTLYEDFLTIASHGSERLSNNITITSKKLK